MNSIKGTCSHWNDIRISVAVNDNSDKFSKVNFVLRSSLERNYMHGSISIKIILFSCDCDI